MDDFRKSISAQLEYVVGRVFCAHRGCIESNIPHSGENDLDKVRTAARGPWRFLLSLILETL